MQAVEINIWIETSIQILEYLTSYDMIKTYRFEHNVDEAFVYKYIKDKIVVFLVLYVDDILTPGLRLGLVLKPRLVC